MDQWKTVVDSYLAGLPPVLAVMAVGGIFLVKHWITTKADFAGDKALGAVSSGYKALAESQQARIAQQDGEIARLTTQNAAYQEQLDRANRENSLLQSTITNMEVRLAEAQIKAGRENQKYGPDLQLIAPVDS